MIQCDKCLKPNNEIDYRYINRQTRQSLRERFGEHRRGIIHNLSDKWGVVEHFNRRNQPVTIRRTIIALGTVLPIWLLLFKQRRMKFKPTKGRLFC